MDEEYKSNAQKCMNEIAEEICGPDYYIVSPFRNFQANIQMVEDILTEFKIRISNDEIERLYEDVDDYLKKSKSNAQDCLNLLVDKILGKDWYIVDSMGGNQANEIIVDNIIHKYEKKTSLMKKLLKWWYNKLT